MYELIRLAYTNMIINIIGRKTLFWAGMFVALNFLQAQENRNEKSGPEYEKVENEFPKDPDAIRILTYNVRHCRGVDGIIDYERITRIISDLDADFVCLQELDSMTQRSGKIDQVKLLGEMTGMHSYFGRAINYQGGKYGIGILSREEAEKTYNYALPGNEKRTVLVAEFPDFIVMSTHLDLEAKHRFESIQIITQKARLFDKETFIAGDFNEGDFSSDVFAELEKDWKLVSPTDNTCPTGNPDKSIDFVLTLKRARENNYKPSKTAVVYSLPNVNVSVASDHYPVFCDFFQ